MSAVSAKSPERLKTVSNVPGTLTKSVFALAIEPLTMALTVTGRKAYDVMLWLAQRSQASPDGGYSSPVSAILRGYGSTTKASERVQRYIEQMVQTTVVWRPLAASEQGTLLLEGFEVGKGEKISDEARTFPLLAEARLFVRGGEAWVTWYYPPSIKEQLISPERWAQIELNSIAKLSTYTAVALYEICARYKDSPGGMTSRHDPDFWTRVLREGGGIKPREFRKFKNELLVPAILEINSETEISVEISEHREHGTLQSVQFKVSRKAKEKERTSEPVDVTLVMRAAKLGVREADLDALVSKYGALKVTEGLEAMETYVNDHRAAKIINRGAYLKAVLCNRFPEGLAGERMSPEEQRPVQLTDPVREQQGLIADWKAARLRQVRGEFAALPEDQQSEWMEKAREHKHFAVMTPALRKRFEAREWESPLISRIVLDVFASAKHGSTWQEPGEMDLVMFSVSEGRDAFARPDKHATGIV